MTKELTVVIPVYNEEEIIQAVIADWASTLRALEIDFVLKVYNDGSKDSTLNKLKEAAIDYPELIVVDKANSGHGPTILMGYCEADSEFVFQVDSDNEIKAEFFAQLWNEREGNDFIIGRREFSYNVPLPRRVVSFIAKYAVKIFYGRGISDVNVPYRLMRQSKFKKIFNAIPSTTFAPNVIISGMAVKSKLRVKDFFVPTEFRATGVVSIQKMKLLKVAIKSFKETISFGLSVK